MKYIIPSLSRTDILLKKSLPLLQRLQIASNSIYIFVIEPEYAAYKEALQTHYSQVHIVAGPLGLHHMRNFIHSYFPAGEELVCLDDDIKQLMIMEEDTRITDVKKAARYPLRELTAEEFKSYVVQAFQILKEKQIKLWGIYPVKNGFFMKDLPEITYDLRFIVGCFWGCINCHDRPINIEEKEDVERTLMYYMKDLQVLRFNRIAPVTSYYKQTGGMQCRGADRIETSKQSCMYLLEKYPGYCKLYTGKKSGIWEVVCKSIVR